VRVYLFSILPTHVEAIWKGLKKKELRRIAPRRLGVGSRVVVYSSAGRKRKEEGETEVAHMVAVGEFTVAGREDVTAEGDLAEVAVDAHVTVAYLRNYIGHRTSVCAIEIGEVTTYPRPVPRSRLKWMGLEPMQNFREIKDVRAWDAFLEREVYA
jgi:predicted transcriptional regulator